MGILCPTEQLKVKNVFFNQDLLTVLFRIQHTTCDLQSMTVMVFSSSLQIHMFILKHIPLNYVFITKLIQILHVMNG